MHYYYSGEHTAHTSRAHEVCCFLIVSLQSYSDKVHHEMKLAHLLLFFCQTIIINFEFCHSPIGCVFKLFQPAVHTQVSTPILVNDNTYSVCTYLHCEQVLATSLQPSLQERTGLPQMGHGNLPQLTWRSCC